MAHNKGNTNTCRTTGTTTPKARCDSRETSRFNRRLVHFENCSTGYSATPITHSECTRAAVIEQGSLEAGLLGGGAVTGSLLDGSTVCYALWSMHTIFYALRSMHLTLWTMHTIFYALRSIHLTLWTMHTIFYALWSMYITFCTHEHAASTSWGLNASLRATSTAVELLMAQVRLTITVAVKCTLVCQPTRAPGALPLPLSCWAPRALLLLLKCLALLVRSILCGGK